MNTFVSILFIFSALLPSSVALALDFDQAAKRLMREKENILKENEESLNKLNAAHASRMPIASSSLETNNQKEESIDVLNLEQAFEGDQIKLRRAAPIRDKSEAAPKAKRLKRSR